MEGNNGHLNKLYRRGGKGRRTFRRWIKWAQSVEFETAVRVIQADKYGAYAEVNKDCIRRDRMFCSLINRHKQGQIDDDTYFDQIVKLNTYYELDLPAEMQRELLES